MSESTDVFRATKRNRYFQRQAAPRPTAVESDVTADQVMAMATLVLPVGHSGTEYSRVWHGPYTPEAYASFNACVQRMPQHGFKELERASTADHSAWQFKHNDGWTVTANVFPKLNQMTMELSYPVTFKQEPVEETASDHVIQIGNQVGQIMDGRQYVGQMLDENGNEFDVWHNARNNTFFRGTSTLIIPDRTIAYGYWKNMSANGMLFVRKLRAFMDKMLTPDQRVPDYTFFETEIPHHPINKQVALYDGKSHTLDLTGGNPLVRQNERFSDNVVAKVANEVIDHFVRVMESVGFSFKSHYYSKSFRLFDTKYQDHALMNQTTSMSKNIALVQQGLDLVMGPDHGFDPMPFQFPQLNGLVPTWWFVHEGDGFKIVGTLSYETGELNFFLR